MRTHTPTIGGKRAADSAGKSESEISSPQDPIVYLSCRPMIPPVRTDPVWGRAQSGTVQPDGRTGPGPSLAVLDLTGLVWTSPNGIIFVNFKVDLKN
jgi:hypothetical protein